MTESFKKWALKYWLCPSVFSVQWWETIDVISSKSSRPVWGSNVSRIYPLYEVALPGSYRYLQENSTWEQVLLNIDYSVALLNFIGCANSSVVAKNCYRSVIFWLPMYIFCREFLALNVYVALCYYKLDYYDVSQVSLMFFNFLHLQVLLPVCCKKRPVYSPTKDLNAFYALMLGL